jgi:hypothetical protein
MGPLSIPNLHIRRAQEVFMRRHRLQVVRVDTFRVTAQMIDLKTLGNWSLELLVRKPMSLH